MKMCRLHYDEGTDDARDIGSLHAALPDSPDGLGRTYLAVRSQRRRSRQVRRMARHAARDGDRLGAMGQLEQHAELHAVSYTHLTLPTM